MAAELANDHPAEEERDGDPEHGGALGFGDGDAKAAHGPSTQFPGQRLGGRIGPPLCPQAALLRRSVVGVGSDPTDRVTRSATVNALGQLGPTLRRRRSRARPARPTVRSAAVEGSGTGETGPLPTPSLTTML